jgi:hypothetical protein
MTKSRLAIAGALTTAILLGVGVGAHAQNAAGRPAPAAQRNIDPAAIKARMDERQAARAGALHDLLAITPAQEGAWRTYQSALRPPVREGRQRGPGAREEMQGLTTPQRLDRMVQEANERHAEVVARVNATRQFYGQLSATQKKAFDALPQVGPGRGGPGADGRMGPRGGRGGFGEGRGPRGPRPAAPAN